MGMTTKRTLLALGLGMALTGGVATAAHASNHTAAHPAVVRSATHAATEQADGATDPAGGANVQSGAQDTSGVDTAEAPAAGEGETTSPAADPAGGPNDQSGAQSGQ